MYYADLHTHSIHSDGTSTSEEIVSSCIRKNIKYLSLTDHDTIDGLAETKKLCVDNNIEFINGVELSADFKGEQIHVLVYGFDINDKKISNLINTIESLRNSRNEKVILKLKNLGIDVDYNKLKLDGIVTRADIAMEIYNLGFAKDYVDAFFKYLTVNGKAYVKKETMDYKEMFNIINGQGAISSLAHPNAYSFAETNLKPSISELKKCGLDAIECYHSSFDNNITNTLLKCCNKYDLLVSGGSDFHGHSKSDVFLGQATNNKFIDYNSLGALIDKCLN